MTDPILVIGGAGKTGRRVARLLQHHQLAVRTASRQTAIPFDWNDESTYAPVLQNMRKVYITFQPDIAIPGARERIAALVAAAKEAGVQKLVLLSGRGEPEAASSEAEVAASGIDYTIIRANWFMQNFSEGFFREGIMHGRFMVPRVAAREPFVDTDDIAEVAVKALLSPKYNGQTYTLSGPAAMSFREAVQMISNGLGKPIEVAEPELDDYVAILQSAQVPAEEISIIHYLFATVLDGRNETVTADIENVLGRPARSFRDYVTKTIAMGLWHS